MFISEKSSGDRLTDIIHGCAYVGRILGFYRIFCHSTC